MKTEFFPSSPEGPEADKLKTGVIKDILEIEDEELLARIFEFVCTDLHKVTDDIPNVVMESAVMYGTDAKSLKLSIISRIIETDNRDYLNACLHFIRRVVHDVNFRNGLDEALEDMEAGRVYRAGNVKDLFQDILGE